MPKNKLSIHEYMNWLLKQYQALQQTRQDAYRIVNIEEKADQCTLTIQIVGKGITFKCKPQEIAADDKMLEQFSKKDVRTIVYFACGEIKKPKKKIIWQSFSEKLNKIIFGVQKRGAENIVEKTADQISIDKELLKELNQEDAHLVGYITATEQIFEEQKQKEALRKQSNDLG